jgi:hypothetical protein
MSEASAMVGRVLQASTTRFTVGCQRPISAQAQSLPAFGALVKVPENGQGMSYGLVYNVAVEDDLFVRQLVAAGVEDDVYIADQRQRRQVPVIVDVLLVGFGSGSDIRYYLPPQPPTSLDKVYPCSEAEIMHFTERNDWLRTVLTAAEIPTDQLIGAALRAAAEARSEEKRQAYLVDAGRELARLLALELARLEGILRQLQDS